MKKSTRSSMSVWMASLGLLFIAMAQSVLAGSSFHYYTDIETSYTVNETNQLSEVNVSWTYDKKMSALMRELSSNFKALGEATIKHLHRHHYFTNIQFNGKPVKTGQVTHFDLQERRNKDKTTLRLDFTLPVLPSLDMTGKNKLTWNFTDPTGVAIMNYSTPKNIRLGRVLQSHCKPLIKENESVQDGHPIQLLSLECSI